MEHFACRFTKICYFNILVVSFNKLGAPSTSTYDVVFSIFLATHFYWLPLCNPETFLILIFVKIFHAASLRSSQVASMQPEDDELYVYFAIRSCGLVGNSSAFDNYLLIHLLNKMYFHISLRDISTEEYLCCI